MITKKIKDLFQFEVKSKFKVNEALEEGEYPFYTSSIKLTKRINTALYNEEAIIFGTGGQASIHHVNTKFSTSTDCLVAISNQKDLNIRFVYYYFIGNMNILEKGFKGAGLKHISKTYIENIEIPIYTIDIQNKIVNILSRLQIPPS